MTTIIEKIEEKLPTDAMLSSDAYEGANIVLYTKNKTFFLRGGDIIKRLVEDFKKRIELRADSTLRKDEETTLKLIKETISKEADVTQIKFDPARSLVIIEAKKPGMAIGKDGANLKTIREQTCWTPIVKRESIITSQITTNIREVLYEESEDRRKFLDKVGKRIYETKRSTTDKKWARISFLGGARQVGRSCMLLQTPESRVLIDCGVNVASDSSAFPALEAPEFSIQDLDAVIISHAHLDHSGFLPYLFKYGYEGPVYCTEATRDVMALLQLDYIQVSHGQLKKPIYSSADIKKVVKNTIPLEYGEVTDITPDVRITLYNAGHILGSSLVHMHIGDGWHNVLYTGDFKVHATRLLNPAHSTFPRVETLIMESTYGGVDLAPREDSEKELVDQIMKIINNKGKALIPVLGVGRAQEVLLVIEEYFRKNKIEYPIYVDGMVWDINAITNMYPRFLNDFVRENVFYKDSDPFLSPLIKQVAGYKERQEVINGGPCVILATSGMLTGGPSVEYLKAFADNKNNGMVFVSYQGEGSLGRRIQRGESTFNIEGEKDLVELKMSVNTIAGLTGHADKSELINYVKNIQPRPRKIILMHGESSKCLEMASLIHKTFKIETVAPRNLDSIRLR